MKLHLAVACVAFAPTLTHATRADTTQRGAPSNSLSRVLGVFSLGDADRDGRISAEEARAIPVASEVFAKEDLDGDGSWSRDEFTLYFRARLVAGGQSVGADLDAEVARIQALKRVRVVEEARKQGVEAPRGRAQVEPVRVRFEKALVDLERSAATKTATPEDFRRLRNLVILSGRSVPEPKTGHLPANASSRMLQTLDRIEKRAAAGQSVREEFETLRTLVESPTQTAPSASPTPIGQITQTAPSDRKSPATNAPAPSGRVAPPSNAGLPTNPQGPIQGPADARRRATEPRGSTRVGPRTPPQPESAKPPTPNPAPKPTPPQDAKKDPGRRSRP